MTIFDGRQLPVSLIMYCMLSSPTQSLASSSALQPFSWSPSAWMTSQRNPRAPKEHVEKGSFRDVFLKLCWSLSGKLVENEKERIPDKLFFTSIFVELLSCNDWISPMFKPVPMFPMRPLRFWCGTKETSHVGRPRKSSVNHLQHVGKVMVWLSF